MNVIKYGKLCKTTPLSSQIIVVKNFNKANNRFCSYGANDSRNEDGEHCDIIISGGGLVGFAAASALGRSRRLENKRILLLEKQQNRNWNLPTEYSNRVCALNSQTQNLFTRLGAWKLIQEMRAQPVKKMQVWEDKSEALITFDEHGTGGATIAHIVENDVVLEALKQRTPNNVEVVYGSNVSQMALPSHSEDKVSVTLDGGRKISADLLVGADGAFSAVRKEMRTPYLSRDYDQSAIVATLELSEEEQDNFVAWQKFMSTGPVAILPLSSNRSSLVWSTTKNQCASLLSLSEERFVDALNNALWQNDDSIDTMVKSIHSRWQELLTNFAPGSRGVLGAQQLPPSISRVIPNSRASYPLGVGHAANYVAPRVALVGDSAHRVHPLAGQGVNLGFGDVTCLVTSLEEGVLQGCNIGEMSQLRKYETSRQRYNVSVMLSIDALYRLYTTSLSPLVLLRSLGVSTLQALNPLKKRIIVFAEG